MWHSLNATNLRDFETRHLKLRSQPLQLALAWDDGHPWARAVRSSAGELEQLLQLAAWRGQGGAADAPPRCEPGLRSFGRCRLICDSMFSIFGVTATPAACENEQKHVVILVRTKERVPTG